MTEREKVVAAVECCFHLGSKGCQSCPYVSEVDLEHGCTVDLAGRIIAQLKAPEARVMTLERIQSGTVEVAWLECSDKEEVRAGLWFKRINEGEDEGIIIHVLEGFEGLRTAVYGKTWRCWTARPTDEQRKAVKWDD